MPGRDEDHKLSYIPGIYPLELLRDKPMVRGYFVSGECILGKAYQTTLSRFRLFRGLGRILTPAG